MNYDSYDDHGLEGVIGGPKVKSIVTEFNDYDLDSDSGVLYTMTDSTTWNTWPTSRSTI